MAHAMRLAETAAGVQTVVVRQGRVESSFDARAVVLACGITFTFGGVRIDPHCRVLDQDGAVIPALYAAGELVGGLFYFNYPGGSGLMAAAVFGRTAGARAARALRA